MIAAKAIRSRPTRSAPVLTIAMELLDVKQRLALVMAFAYVTSTALKAQNADRDSDAALVLQRAVGDELDRQIERLDVLAQRCRKVAS